MSADITRGPKLCPSCGKENPPTAARCVLCATPLDGAVQTTPHPAWDVQPDRLDSDAKPPVRSMRRAAAVVGLCWGAFIGTFCCGCVAWTPGDYGPNYSIRDVEVVSAVLAAIGAPFGAAIGWIIGWMVDRRRRRWDEAEQAGRWPER